MKVLVGYYTRGGTTKKMAELISDAVRKEGVEVDCKAVTEIDVQELAGYDGIVLGSPTYYGLPAAEIKKLLDDSVALHGKLDGKVGGAFSSAANIAGGNETAIMAIVEALLIHGMIVQGDPRGSHYGPVAIGKVDERVEIESVRFAQRLVQLLKLVERRGG